MSDLTTYSQDQIVSLQELTIDPENLEASLFSEGQKSIAEEEYYVGGGSSWRAHRVFKNFGNADKIHWAFPKKASDPDPEHSEILPGANHHFVAFIGLPLKVEYGFSFTKGEGSDFKQICRTTKLEYMTGQSSRVIENNLPLPFPVTQINRSKKDPHSINYALESRPHIKLYGSRPPVGQDPSVKTAEVRSCAECVRAGEFYDGTLDDFLTKPTTPSCRMTGAVTFVVFKLGIMDPQPLLEGTGPVGVNWVDVKDAKLRQADGTFLDRPFILRMQGMGKVQHMPIGTGEFERNIIRKGAECYLPPEVYSWGQYFDYLHKKGKTRTLRTGDTAYLQGTAMYIAKHPKQEMLQNYMPVFSPVELGDPVKALSLGIQVQQMELALAEGGATPEPYSGEWPQVLGLEAPAVLPAAETAIPAFEGAKQTSAVPAAPDWEKAQLKAFKP